MRKSMIVCISVLVIAFIAAGCSTVSDLSSFMQWEFRMQGVRDVAAAGVRISGKKSMSDLSVLDAGKIMFALKQDSLPVKMVLDVEVRNPNRQTAALNRAEYIAYLDGNEIFSGSTTSSIKIPGNKVATLPLNVQFDILKLMEGKTQDAILNLLFNLAGGSGVPSTLTLKLKPSVSVGRSTISYPGYLEVTTQYGGK
ncbi:MAG TPA: LEA type 2 family protein [Spirochaetia bacterium]|nr:LEA type 2 family protein [Spirochaetia bacterium]